MASNYDKRHSVTVVAAAAVGRFRFVGYGGTHASTAGGLNDAQGISESAAAVGSAVSLITNYSGLVEAAEAIPAGAYVRPAADGSGRAVVGTEWQSCGRAIDAAAAPGDVLQCRFLERPGMSMPDGIYDFPKRGGLVAIDWSKCAIGAVTSGWNVSVDPTERYCGFPVLRVTTNGAPSGGTTLTVTITLPGALYLGGTKKMMFGVKPGDRAEAGDATNYPQLWINVSAGGTHRIIVPPQSSSADGDWFFAGPYDQDASGTGFITGVAEWAKIGSETVTSVRLVLTCAAGGISQPLFVGPLITDADATPTLTIFMDGNYSGQYNFARQLLNSYGFKASLATIPYWITQGVAGTMTAAQMDRMHSDGHENIHHTGTDGGSVGWDSTSKYPDGQEYALVRADVEATWAYFRQRGWLRGIGYGVVGFTNGLVKTQTLARRNNITRALRDAGLVKIRQLNGYIGSHYEHAGASQLVTQPTTMVQNTTTTPVATVTGVVDKLIVRGGWTGLTYHDIVLSGEAGTSRNVASVRADWDYVWAKVKAGQLRVLPFSEAMPRVGSIPAPVEWA